MLAGMSRPVHLGDSPGHSGVVSYVRRSPRMNQSQRNAMTKLGQRYLVDVPRGELSTSVATSARVDWSAEFGRPVDQLVVEIGSGSGDALVANALAKPDACLVAFEVYERAVASTLGKLDAAGIDNVRLLMVDGVAGLQRLIPPNSVTELSSFFPDPWHKKRHHKRRLVSPSFAELAASRLTVGGRWLLATDWPDYAGQMRRVLDATPVLANEYPDGWAPRPAWRPITRFEHRGLAAGRPVFDLSYRRMA